MNQIKEKKLFFNHLSIKKEYHKAVSLSEKCVWDLYGMQTTINYFTHFFFLFAFRINES